MVSANQASSSQGAKEISSSVNIASHLPRMAQLQPYTRAVVFPHGRDEKGRVSYIHLTFKQLDELSDAYARGFEKIGIRRQTRTILMVKPSLEFFALTFALFKVGAIPVLIDPGMGVKRMLHCLQETQSQAFIGIPLAHALRVLFPKYFRSIKTHVTVGKRWFWGGPTLEKVPLWEKEPYQMAPTDPQETAAILFTTGSTGPAKGVVYEHATFDAQVQSLKESFGILPGEIDVPTFPLFALFAPALGMTAVIPDMDPTRPAEVDPKKIVEAIHNHGATTMFGSPALLKQVARYITPRGITFPTLGRVISAGAPVPHDILEQFQKSLPEKANIFTPYGATEALPVCAIEGREILGETKKMTAEGKGICVGHPVKNREVHIIKISDDPIADWSDDLVLPKGQIGEVVVTGAVVTKEYYLKPEKTAAAKIYEKKSGQNRVWHRMGDLGWMDEENRVWFCGRKAHRVITQEETLFTIPCEAIFNQHKRIYRSALVGIGPANNKKPVICIEREAQDSGRDLSTLKQELLEMAQKNPLTEKIETILFHPSFPVDIRHNAKIFREKLTLWAEKKV